MPIVYYVASLRFGGEKKTYGDHVLVVGDAAGMHIITYSNGVVQQEVE